MLFFRFYVFVMMFVLSCTLYGVEHNNTSNSGYNINCSASQVYRPAQLPILTQATERMPSGTVIYMHGRAGSPTRHFDKQLQQQLAALGYDVVAPYMPWAKRTWTGTMCEGMLYINELARLEIKKGRRVILMGHSMGGAHALFHGRLRPGVEIKAYVAIAPGHLPHRSEAERRAYAASVNAANKKSADGNADQVTDFSVPVGKNTLTIKTTANIFLSFFDVERFPDINKVLPEITKPVLIVSADRDPVTGLYNHAAMRAMIRAEGTAYKRINGDHFTVLENVAEQFDLWLKNLAHQALAVPERRL